MKQALLASAFVALGMLGMSGCATELPEDELVDSAQRSLAGPGSLPSPARAEQGWQTSNHKPGTVVCKNGSRFGVLTSHHELGDWSGQFVYAQDTSKILNRVTSPGDGDGCTRVGTSPMFLCRMTSGSPSATNGAVAGVGVGVGATSGALIDAWEYASSGFAGALNNPIITTRPCTGTTTSTGSVRIEAKAQLTSSLPIASCRGTGNAVNNRAGTWSCQNDGGTSHGTACCAFSCVGGSGGTGGTWTDTAGCGAYAPACQVPSVGNCGAQPMSSYATKNRACSTNTFRGIYEAGVTNVPAGWYPNEPDGTNCLALVGNSAVQGGAAFYPLISTVAGVVDADSNDSTSTPFDDRFYSVCTRLFSQSEVNALTALASNWCYSGL